MLQIRIALAVVVCGCNASYGTVASHAVDSAIVANNGTVDMLRSIQEKAVEHRKALLLRIARTAESKTSGERKIGSASARYAAVFDAFRSAEAVQNALADSLVVAQASIEAGKAPSMGRVFSLYSQFPLVIP